MRQAGYVIGGDYFGDGGGRDNSGGVSCQDCGNQAKKDCQHMRCRTCCRSRGLPCETHVKSTWVPAAKRRERRQQVALSPQQQSSGDQQLSLMITSGDGGAEHIQKRIREDCHHHHHIRGGMVPTTNLQNTSSGFPFPAELNSPTLFRCVRVSGMDETDEQMAYQTAISVGGHVFNGILYDHGPDQGQYNHPVAESSSTTGIQHQDANLITYGTTASSSSSNIYQAVTIIDPSSMYPTPLCAFIPGTQFFPPPRP